jgi:hypothetical protein
LTLAVTILLALAGWVAAHLLTSRREMEQKKREFRVTHLRGAYLKLANVADRGSLQDNVADVQDAFNDIQLFGERAQIDMVGQFVERAKRGESPAIDELLRALRNEIRQHIGLAPIEGYRWWIRVSKREDGDRAGTGRAAT